MGAVKGFINALADPRLFFILALVSLVLMVWKREFAPARRYPYDDDVFADG